MVPSRRQGGENNDHSHHGRRAISEFQMGGAEAGSASGIFVRPVGCLAWIGAGRHLAPVDGKLIGNPAGSAHISTDLEVNSP